MTKNRIGLLALSLVSLTALASCTRTVSEIHDAGQYSTASFEKNYLLGVHEYPSATTKGSIILDGTTNAFFGQNDSPNIHDVQVKTNHDGRYASIFDYNGVELEDDKIGLNVEVKDYPDQDRSSYIGKDFGLTKCLEAYDSSFKYGVMSRLYNGQTKCFGTGTAGRVQIDKRGFEKKFPKTAVSGDYCLFSIRGATDYYIVRSDGSNQAPESHDMTIDLTLKVFKGDESQEFVMKNVAVMADGDGAGENVSYVGFKFSDFGYDFSGTTGYGLSFEYKSDSKYGFVASEGSDNAFEKKDDTVFHYSLMLYETMFPDSTWR